MCLIITKPWWNEYFTYYKGNTIPLRLSFYSNHLSFNFYEFSKSVLIFFISLTKRVQEPAVECGVIARELGTKDRNAKKVGTSLPQFRLKRNKLKYVR